MTLIFRETEAENLSRQLWLSQYKSSRMSLLLGNHATGKTSLAVYCTRTSPTVYLKMTGRSEALLLTYFKEEVQRVLGVYVPPTVESILEMVSFLLDVSLRQHFSLILDKIDEYLGKDVERCYPLRKKWDETKKEGHLNLILVASSPFVAQKLFYLFGSPFTNCLDMEVRVRPFTVAQISSLVSSRGLAAGPADLLALYGATGGLPEMVVHMVDAGIVQKDEIVRYCLGGSSFFTKEGERRILSVLGKTKDVYLSILQLISQGYRTQAEIEAHIGGFNVGGHLSKLEVEYGLITKTRPLLASESSRNVVRFEITDPFLMTYLRYVESNRALFDTFNYEEIVEKALQDYPRYAKVLLCRHFRTRFETEYPGSEIGGDWKAGDPSEIDLMVLDRKDMKVLLSDIEYGSSDFNKAPFLERVNTLKGGPLAGYRIDSRLFTIEDM